MPRVNLSDEELHDFVVFRAMQVRRKITRSTMAHPSMEPVTQALLIEASRALADLLAHLKKES